MGEKSAISCDSVNNPIPNKSTLHQINSLCFPAGFNQKKKKKRGEKGRKNPISKDINQTRHPKNVPRPRQPPENAKTQRKKSIFGGLFKFFFEF